MAYTHPSCWLVRWRVSCVVVVLLLWIRELDGLWAVSIVEPNPGGWGFGTGPSLVLSTSEQRLPIHHRLQIEPGYNQCLYWSNVHKLYKLVDGTTCWLQNRFICFVFLIKYNYLIKKNKTVFSTCLMVKLPHTCFLKRVIRPRGLLKVCHCQNILSWRKKKLH